MTAEVLTPRALNRATLARQLLLDRQPMAVLDAVEHLVGLQAQVPLDPYHGLWSRLEGFRPDDLGRLLLDRRVVRIVVMRGTIHLVTAEDALLLRPLVQPVLDRELRNHRERAPKLAGVDLGPVLVFARARLADGPLTATQFRRALAEAFPDLDPNALAFACRNHLALIQVPPMGVWGRRAPLTYSTAEAWLGRAPVADPSIDEVVVRYLSAFGPALVADVAAWCGLPAMREVLDRLRPRLRTFRDERGRELFDVPDAPTPDPDTPAPVRFLPEYDNVLLSHADRSRFGTDVEQVRQLWAARVMKGSVLHDGLLRGAWAVDRDGGGTVTLTVVHLPLAKRARAAIGVEGRRLLRFLAPDAAGHDLRLEPVG